MILSLTAMGSDYITPGVAMVKGLKASVVMALSAYVYWRVDSDN